MIVRLTHFVLRDVIRGKWLVLYMTFFLMVTEGLLYFTAGESRTVVGLMNVVLLLIPLASVVFGVMHVYNGRDFMELMLTQPVQRSNIYFAMYSGVTAAFLGAFLIGVGIPALLHGIAFSPPVLTLLGTGALLTLVFFAIAYLIAVVVNDKVTGLGIAFVVWLAMAIVYDGLILAITVAFSDYPLETATIGMVVFNPIDMARIVVMLTFDYAALMGYTGAVFRTFFGSGLGVALSLVSMVVWIVVPLAIGRRAFEKKDW